MYKRLSIITLFFFCILSAKSYSQLSFVVNSLADDQYSYAYDDPATPEDESRDGTCMDELGRCTIRAAIDEAFIMEQYVDLTFSVNGTINLMDLLFLPDNSSMSGNNQIAFSNPFICFQLENDCTIQGIKIMNAMVGVEIQGNNNAIGVDMGDYNEIVNCQTGLSVSGDGNKIINTFFGITFNNVLQPNGVGLMLVGNDNEIGINEPNQGNIFCGNTIAGIIIGDGEGNIVEGNYIGTNLDQQTGLGNAIGIMITSDNNVIGGSGTFSPNVISGNQIGIALQAAPPDVYADNNRIVNNIIGLSKFENLAIPNNNGIAITNGVTNAKIYDNVISGNTNTGIGIFGYDVDSFTSGHEIYRNKIGVNKNGAQYANNVGVSVIGNVGQVAIGVNEFNELGPNTIVGNNDTGVEIESYGGFSPSEIVFRKNLIYQNGLINLFIDAQSNLGFSAPQGLSFSGNTLTGVHPLSGMIIDVYRASNTELSASAYEWLGSTTTTTNGSFSFIISDPTVHAVSVTATNPFISTTSGFAKYTIVTSVEDEKHIPDEFSLEQNYPNPFNPSTVINYQLPVSGDVSLIVYDVLGNEIAVVVDEFKEAGMHKAGFNASGLSSGVYLYKLSAGSFIEIKKMTVLK